LPCDHHLPNEKRPEAVEACGELSLDLNQSQKKRA
jgi:hypothetical protein